MHVVLGSNKLVANEIRCSSLAVVAIQLIRNTVSLLELTLKWRLRRSLNVKNIKCPRMSVERLDLYNILAQPFPPQTRNHRPFENSPFSNHPHTIEHHSSQQDEVLHYYCFCLSFHPPRQQWRKRRLHPRLQFPGHGRMQQPLWDLCLCLKRRPVPVRILSIEGIAEKRLVKSEGK